MAKKSRKESGSLNFARPILDFINDFVMLFLDKSINGYFFGDSRK
jgi:hypothetical protein